MTKDTKTKKALKKAPSAAGSAAGRKVAGKTSANSSHSSTAAKDKARAPHPPSKDKEVPVKATNKKTAPLSPREERILMIKANLQKQKEYLLSGAESALNELPGETIFPDLGDQASVETDRNFMLRLRGREQRLLKKIEEAIDRIDQGSFGICDDCGNEIDIKRLEARPVTTMCIECKTLQEEEEKLREG